MDNSNGGSIAIGVGIPSVVVGVLIALKKVGMTTMSYSDIAWFGFPCVSFQTACIVTNILYA